MKIIFYILTFILGSSMVSFLTVLAYEFPKGEFLNLRRSQCDVCGKQLKWYHTVPILSYLLLKGKGYCCKKPINIVYPLSEFFGGMVFVLTIITEKNIPIVTSIFIMMTIFAFMDYFYGYIYPIFYLILLPSIIINFPNLHLISSLLIFSTLHLLAYISKGLGFGDIEVLALLTLLLGAEIILKIIILACFLCLVHFLINKKRSFRFIPYLTISTGIVYLIFG
ncbi:prepilin peptidase [Companilactobacillus mishanensis]|uniref:Prepilin peptidase n=1 Tax=Companilactobacillus mishanensis TaxID=2486008 RepID=A0A5P0ZH66_9LACO|nr:A24 family peptidase [Companilactobacillus mishanensis]MQS52401.1 prepilin peptidase [Companilactobacillus mishanensis]